MTTGKKVFVVAGYGPGISAHVVDTFAAKGFSIALLSRTQAKVDKAAEALKAKGVEAAGFATDLTQPEDVKASLAKVADTLGPVTVLFWNFISPAWGDYFTLPLDLITKDVTGGILSLTAAVQAVAPDLEGQQGAAILLTGGGFSLAPEQPGIAGFAVSLGGIVPAFVKAAQRNLTYTLDAALKPKGVRVAEVVVTGVVSGSEFAEGINNPGNIKPEDVAALFWQQYTSPDGPVSVTV